MSLDLEAKMSAGKSQDPKLLSATPIPINTAVFSLLAAKPDHQVFSVSLRDIEQVLKPKKFVDPATLLPAQYHKFLDIFSKDDTDKLPPLHSGVDHKIKMEPGTQAPSGPLYSMSREELEVLKKYLTDVTVLAQLHIWHKSRTLPGSSICTVACLLHRCLIPCL